MLIFQNQLKTFKQGEHIQFNRINFLLGIHHIRIKYLPKRVIEKRHVFDR